MDRYVIRESKVGVDYPQSNQQMMKFSTHTGANSIVPSESVFFGSPYCPEFSTNNIQRVGNNVFTGATVVNTPFFTTAEPQSQGQVVSGIDPMYLAAYSNNNAAFIATGQRIQTERNSISANSTFGIDYQNRNLIGADKSKAKTFSLQASEPPRREEVWKNKQSFGYDNKNSKGNTESQQKIQQRSTNEKNNKEVDLLKNEAQSNVKSRSDILKALHKSGPRAFSGPVEKVLKWHKALQDIGVLVLYEIVAKCVNIRPGESCAKNLVIRDDNGPAMQVVYYEIDFFLPELTPPCTIRVVGRMMPGTCRLQAYNVRLATGDDVSTLPRRAAVATHHIAKLCKEYGVNADKI